MKSILRYLVVLPVVLLGHESSNGQEIASRVYLPADICRGVSNGEAIEHRDINIPDSRGGRNRSVFTDKFLLDNSTAGESEEGVSSMWDIETFDSFSQLTKKSSFALKASGSIGWASAAASVNRTSFHEVGKEKFESRIFVRTVVNRSPLKLKVGRDSFNEDVLKMLEDAGTAAEERDFVKLNGLRQQFRRRYGTGFVSSIDRGAQYQLRLEQQIDKKKDINTSRIDFNAKCKKFFLTIEAKGEVTEEQTKELREVGVKMSGKLFGGPEKFLQGGDVDSLIKYLNDTGQEEEGFNMSWIKAARERSVPIGATFVPYYNIPELKLLAFNPSESGGGHLTQVFGDTLQGESLTPIYCFVQFAPIWGVRQFAVVPIPHLREMHFHEDGLGCDLGFQISGESLEESGRKKRWEELVAGEAPIEANGLERLEEGFVPEILKESPLGIRMRYPRGFAQNLKLARSFDPNDQPENPSGLSSPPFVEQVYRKCNTLTGDMYWMRFHGSENAIQRFRELALEGQISYVPTVYIDGVDAVDLRAITFKVTENAGGVAVENPKFLEGLVDHHVIADIAALEEAVKRLKSRRYGAYIPWNGVNIGAVAKGDVVSITCKGEESYVGSGAGYGTVVHNPDGQPRMLQGNRGAANPITLKSGRSVRDGSPLFSIIGQIIEPDGKIAYSFHVGRQRSLVVPKDGTLRLLSNYQKKAPPKKTNTKDSKYRIHSSVLVLP